MLMYTASIALFKASIETPYNRQYSSNMLVLHICLVVDYRHLLNSANDFDLLNGEEIALK